MKQIILIFLVSIFLISCKNVADNNINESETISIEAGKGVGMMCIEFKDSISRSLITSEIASSLCKGYYLYIYNNTDNYAEEISNGTLLTMNPGTYNAVLYATTSSGQTYYAKILGSSYKTNIVIEEGKTTNVKFIILPFGLEFVVPEFVEPGQDFVIKYIVNTRNPYLVNSYTSGINDNYSLKSGVNSELGTWKSTIASISGTVITYTITYTATSTVPSVNKTYLITESGDFLTTMKIRDDTYNFTVGDSSLKYAGYGGYSAIQTEGMTCGAITLRNTVTTGISTTIEWND